MMEPIDIFMLVAHGTMTISACIWLLTQWSVFLFISEIFLGVLIIMLIITFRGWYRDRKIPYQTNLSSLQDGV